MSEQLAAIRARWAGVAWHYTEDWEGSYHASSIIHSDDTTHVDLEEPTPAEIVFLRLAAQAPADIAALLAELDAASAIAFAARRYHAAIMAGDGIMAAESALFAAIEATPDLAAHAIADIPAGRADARRHQRG